jgi:hypothetical protein
LFSSLHFRSGQRRLWIKLMGAMLIVLVLGTVLHVHPNGADGTVCMVCVSAQTSAPTSVFLPAVVLIALSSVILARPAEDPAPAPEFSSFIRPPPAL